VHQLACALQRQGCEVHVLYSKAPGEKIEIEVPYKIHWTRGFNVATVNLDIFSFAGTLSRLAKQERFDIVHGNGEEAFFSSGICQKLNAIAFFTSHAPYVPTTGIFRALLSPISFLKTINPHLLRSAACRATKIITFSRFSRDLVLHGLGQKYQDRVEVIPGGIDPSWFEVERRPSEKQEILFWGRMEDEKGIPELLDALKIVARKIPDVKLTLVGEGHRLEDYKQRVRKLGLIPKVVMPGWQSVEAIQKLSATARVAVFPSRIESFGLAVAEALGGGVPLVATHAGALPEIVEDGVAGTLVPPRDPEALADALSTVLAHKENFQAMALRGQEIARKKHSWDGAARQLIELYRQALATREKALPD
jgi:glycosyltransferase involved in cell wall biosynthesis